ncbi:MAG: tetratricopeptide repeat protein [Verrucomicrobiota bacterium]
MKHGLNEDFVQINKPEYLSLKGALPPVDRFADSIPEPCFIRVHPWLISSLVLPLLVLAGCSGVKFTHVTPGQSVEVALAKKATAVPTPTPVPYAMVQGGEMPNKNMEEVEDSFALGSFCLEGGKTAEAISAFEKVVKLDPSYAEAWSKLATAYQAVGKKEKADEAMKKFKSLTTR